MTGIKKTRKSSKISNTSSLLKRPRQTGTNQADLRVIHLLRNTVKPVLMGHSKIDKAKVVKPCGSLMQGLSLTGVTALWSLSKTHLS